MTPLIGGIVSRAFVNAIDSESAIATSHAGALTRTPRDFHQADSVLGSSSRAREQDEIPCSSICHPPRSASTKAPKATDNQIC